MLDSLIRVPNVFQYDIVSFSVRCHRNKGIFANVKIWYFFETKPGLRLFVELDLMFCSVRLVSSNAVLNASI